MLAKLNELRKGREGGFTLIELLVVIGIIGTLAAVALPIFLNQQKTSVISSVKSDVRNTVTNVSTALAANPDLAGTSAFGWSKTGQAAMVTVGHTGTTPKFQIVTSGANNKIVVATAGSYTVTGINATSLGAEATNYYQFNSTTGLYTSAGSFLV